MAEWLNAARQITTWMIRVRRHLHQNPELSFQEFETAAFVEAELRNLGLHPRKVTDTGVVAELEGGLPGPTVLIRADMDALPIQEESGASYASRRPGMMHACGHDAHTSIALGVAKLLQSCREQMPGAVRFVFQPGEETPPGGALGMVRAGVASGASAVLGLHQDTSLRAGHVAVRPGPFLSSSDQLTLRLACSGGGGSAPHRGTDGIMLAAQGLVSLQAMLSRRVDPLTPALLSMGTIQGGVKENVLADRVTITGIMRTMDAGLRELLPALVRQTLEGVALGQEARWEVEVTPGYPPVINDTHIAAVVSAAVEDELGAGALREAPALMAADDMAYFMEQVPGCYFLLGAGNPDRGLTAPAHTARFDMDEEALHVGASVLAAAAWRLLTEPGVR